MGSKISVNGSVLLSFMDVCLLLFSINVSNVYEVWSENLKHLYLEIKLSVNYIIFIYLLLREGVLTILEMVYLKVGNGRYSVWVVPFYHRCRIHLEWLTYSLKHSITIHLCAFVTLPHQRCLFRLVVLCHQLSCAQ